MAHVSQAKVLNRLQIVNIPPSSSSLASRSSRLAPESANLLFFSSKQRHKCVLKRNGNRGTALHSARSSISTTESVVVNRTNTGRSFSLKAVVTIKKSPTLSMTDSVLEGVESILADPVARKIVLQLVSCEIDPKTGLGKRSQEVTLQTRVLDGNLKPDELSFTTEFKTDPSFGIPRAVVVVNKLRNEFFLETISISGATKAPINFSCYSWIHTQENTEAKRVFFSNQVYLPSETPEGLKDLREAELRALRGTGKGLRKKWERVYDYDVYNDLGDPNKGPNSIRPTLGGSKKHPYPRRCRTGRPPCKNDATCETRLPLLDKIYVPRDEDFDQIKAQYIAVGRMKGIINRLVPAIVNHFREAPKQFQSFSDIDRLYHEGLELTTYDDADKTIWDFLPIPGTIKQVISSRKGVSHLLQFPVPELLHRDKFAWMRDSEFGRQMLCGINPLRIRRLTEFPPVSQLDETYGLKMSAFKEEHLLPSLEGLTVEEAIAKEKLFIVDYYDIFMPFVERINALDGRKTYATRTILYSDKAGILRPIAIELSLPPSETRPQGSKRVMCPGHEPTINWLWQLAKTHVSNNHCGYHQLVCHWLRAHACMEPYVIATHRQLSTMHPIYKLLLPHLRYTLDINGAARQTLISVDGIIEKCFTPGQYALEMSSAAYAAEWRFDKEGLPADLIKRGMAVEDPSAPHGLRLVLEDYPYAADGLLVWSSIKSWVETYVSLYYRDPETVINDVELQNWWTEIRTQGHRDKKDEPWWPSLKNKEDLSQILTTIIWIAAGHHTGVNFGQFFYAGYVPNLPCLTRKLIPEEGDIEYKRFLQNPQKHYLGTLPSQVQATTVMAALEALSTHSSDEEYLGTRTQRNWTNDNEVLKAFQKFSHEIESLEAVISARNNDPKLKNRHGAGVPPYELFCPKSGPGITARGVPNSISV